MVMRAWPICREQNRELHCSVYGVGVRAKQRSVRVRGKETKTEKDNELSNLQGPVFNEKSR